MRSNRPDQTLPETEILRSLKRFPINLLKVYPKSFSVLHGRTYGLVRTPEGKKFVVIAEKERGSDDPFRGKTYSHGPSTLKVCDLSTENSKSLMAIFPYTKPIPLRNHMITIGTGDRLGVASPGHIRAIQKFQVRPVLAQQSVRENKQTGRSFSQVIHDAAWAVFQENDQGGYGADGDHLKSLQEVGEALEAGVSMVTLDLSEKLNFWAFTDSKEAIDRKFQTDIDEEDAKVLFHLFLDKAFSFKGPQGEFAIRFDEEGVKRNALLFHQALDFTEEVSLFIRSHLASQTSIDFEISVDETPFPTSPQNHLFFVLELSHRGVRIDSLAPRFIGEFQKGIDYRGDLVDFRRQFYQHALIAQDYGNYKISIHSGSDKFSVFPAIGELARGGFHVKTAGTSWLEAMRLISLMAPSLYREMHRFSLSRFDEASRLYHVTTDLGKIPRLEEMADRDLPAFLDREDSRQLLHITYGYLLNAKDENGKDLFKDRFYHILTQYEEDYLVPPRKAYRKASNHAGIEA